MWEEEILPPAFNIERNYRPDLIQNQLCCIFQDFPQIVNLNWLPDFPGFCMDLYMNFENCLLHHKPVVEEYQMLEELFHRILWSPF